MLFRMLSRKSLRRWLSVWLVLAVLFTQVATAAYVCPMATAVLAFGAASAEMADASAARLDPDRPGLCIHHCQGGSQTIDQANPASVPAPALLPTLVVRMPGLASLELPAWAAQQRSRDRDGPLPHSIDHCCYRI